MSVIVTAVFTAKPGQREELKQALLDSIPPVHEEDGCELFALHDATDGTLVYIEKWTSVETLDAHGAGAPVEALNAAIAPHLASAPVVTRMFAVAGGSAEQGLL